MKKTDAIAYVNASDFDNKVKAGACIAISLMPKGQWEGFSALADEGLTMLRAGDYDGIQELLRKQNVEPGILVMVANMIAAIKSHSIGELPSANSN